MLTRILLILGAFLACPASAQPSALAPAATDEGTVRVALDTSAGRIVVAVDTGHAPITSANFLRYVDAHRYDGQPFYRAMKLWEGTGLVQGGVRDATKLYPPIAHEPTSQTGIHHGDGTISMAREKAGSARSDFFITVGTIEGFDAGKDPSGDNLGYAAFGQVVEGMNVVKAILAAPVSPTSGEKEGMRGQMLEPVIRIVKATRVQP